jgi:deazaflavin-dependent oxidoreductase (nitroreductase family)
MGSFSQRLMSTANRLAYNATGGKLGGHMQQAPVGILTTVGRRSGKLRQWPLLYVEDDAGWVVAASNGGSPQHPAWYFNVTANPDVTWRVGSTDHAVHAEVVDGDEREQQYARLKQQYDGYDKYETKTDRVFPIVRLRRAAARPAAAS